ncbi:MAG: ribonuclease P protein component, partial [Oscillospiraceae bacterium]|nr:ribonuclease P protein component [Oscillospiraceae bacterium]
MLFTQILNQNADFQRLYRSGAFCSLGSALLYVKPNRLPYNRLGITAGKKIGNAVTVDEKLTAVVNAIGKHPAVLYYYNSDEVPEEFMDQVLAMRHTLNRLDPGHPVMTLTNDPKLLPKFAQLGDIFCNDNYPIMKKNDPRDLSSISV